VEDSSRPEHNNTSDIRKETLLAGLISPHLLSMFKEVLRNNISKYSYKKT
jgi:hypothetical protein